MLRITVVTICFNNLDDLMKTCKSVDQQLSPPFEHWIIDGSSSGDIACWLQEQEQPGYRKWICERDKGIADAFNKGIARADGDIIQLLNSGDIYAGNKVLEQVEQAFRKDQSMQWLTGMICMHRVGVPVVVGKPFDSRKLYRGMRSVSHPTWFVKRSVYDKTGPYDPAYAIAMDYEMMCRLTDFKVGFLKIPFVIFDDSGISTNNYLAALSETKKAYQAHFGYSFRMECWQMRLKILYALQQTRAGRFLFQLKRKLGLENL